MPQDDGTISDQALRDPESNSGQDGAEGDQVGDRSTPDGKGSFEDAIARGLEQGEDKPEGNSEGTDGSDGSDESDESDATENGAGEEAEPSTETPTTEESDLESKLDAALKKIEELEARAPAETTGKAPEKPEEPEQLPETVSECEEWAVSNIQKLTQELRELKESVGQVAGSVKQEKDVAVLSSFKEQVDELCEAQGITLTDKELADLYQNTGKLGDMPLDKATETMFRGMFSGKKPTKPKVEPKPKPAAVGSGQVSTRVRPVTKAATLGEAIYEAARREGIE